MPPYNLTIVKCPEIIEITHLLRRLTKIIENSVKPPRHIATAHTRRIGMQRQWHQRRIRNSSKCVPHIPRTWWQRHWDAWNSITTICNGRNELFPFRHILSYYSSLLLLYKRENVRRKQQLFIDEWIVPWLLFIFVFLCYYYPFSSPASSLSEFLSSFLFSLLFCHLSSISKQEANRHLLDRLVISEASSSRKSQVSSLMQDRRGESVRR